MLNLINIENKIKSTSGFTLIELSIVLVVIGLIVGGILVGRDLISAAAVRAQITQIEQYQQAVNTFRVKYGYLPGDIKEPEASNFGFVTRGNCQNLTPCIGQGDGDGVIEAQAFYSAYAPVHNGYRQIDETLMFWRDLSTAKLIKEQFTLATFDHTDVSIDMAVSNLNAYSASYHLKNINAYVPDAKIASNTSIYLWSGRFSNDQNNYFGISGVDNIAIIGASGAMQSHPTLTIAQAYSIDKKMDDGLPQLGKIQTLFIDTDSAGGDDGIGVGPFVWATKTGEYNMGDYDGVTGGGINSQTTSPVWDDNTDLSKLCYYNGHQTGTPEIYNMAYPTMPNCAISIRMQ